jgi:predicted SAM-dependent methyltransferase
MTIKQKIYQLLPFIPKTNLLISQTLHPIKVKLNKGNVKAQLSNKTAIYANIACGSVGLPGDWINIDYGQHKNVNHVFDCRKSVPFADNTVKGMFCEHFFEHLDYFNEVPYFLASCYHSLQNGGVLRIVVPDAEKYMIGYCTEGWDYLKKVRPLNENLIDGLMGMQYQTKMQLINEVFRQSGQHKYAWDYETMKLALENAGFSKIYKMDYLKSNDSKLEIDQLIRKPESLYVEAIK